MLTNRWQCPFKFIVQLSGAVAKFQAKSRPTFKSSEDILSKMWGCVRASNGIKVLLSLLMVKTPLVDADCIRALACKALCGLSRSDKIRQVIGKLQLFNSGQLQSKWYSVLYVIYQTRESVFHPISKWESVPTHHPPLQWSGRRREFKIRRVAEYFRQNSRCLEI